jgi:hypothetical protein
MTTKKVSFWRKSLYLPFILASIGAQAGGKVDAVAAFELAADFAYSDFNLGVMSMAAGDNAGWATANDKMRADSVKVDNAVESAIRQAKGHPHLEQAIREFYQAATALYSAGIPASPIEKARRSPLVQAYEAKEKALMLEVKLAK